MPNHVTTKLTVEGPADLVQTFRLRHIRMTEEHESFHFDLSTIVPRPAVLEGTVSGSKEDECLQNKLALEQTGFQNWYEWSVEKWGTKWNSYEFNWVSQEPGKLVFTFETAWSVPWPVIDKLVEMYPGLEFTALAFDEMWNWAQGAVSNPKLGKMLVHDLQPTAVTYKQVYGYAPDVTPEEETVQ